MNSNNPVFCYRICVVLQYLPTVLVTAELLMSAAAQLPSFTTHSLALLVWSLGALRLKPNKQYLRLLLRQARYRFRCVQLQ